MVALDIIAHATEQMDESGRRYFKYALMSYLDYKGMLSALKRRNVVNRMYKAGKNKVKCRS